MKITNNINLGGLPFTIDNDAYELLDKYLEAVHRQFRFTEGQEEIVHDIELRIAELFVEKNKSHQIISKSHVAEIINIMGMPEEMMGEETMETNQNQETMNSSKRKLFRDSENKILGGVCAGLAAYFGFKDILWMRIIFVVGTIMSSGLGFFLYAILWGIVPKAITASDKLSMRGEPINIHSIGEFIEEEVSDFAEKISDLASKKKVKINFQKTRNRCHPAGH